MRPIHRLLPLQPTPESVSFCERPSGNRSLANPHRLRTRPAAGCGPMLGLAIQAIPIASLDSVNSQPSWCARTPGPGGSGEKGVVVSWSSHSSESVGS
jgi:hypothetical protein